MSGRNIGERVGRQVSRAIVVAAYLTALMPAWAMAEALDTAQPVAVLGLAYLLSALVIWLWSMMLDNSSMFDAWWSVLPPLVATWLAVGHGAGVPGARIAVVMAVVWLWGVRLTTNWGRDWPGLHHEDWRYLDLFAKGPKPLISLFGVHLFPCAVVFLGSLSLVPAVVRGTRPVGALDAAALVLGLAASVIEFVADEQMRRFRRTTTTGGVMDRGLWRWSRHPNYFGELCFWWSLWLFGVAAAPGWWWTVIGPVALTAMFLFASIPMLDERSAQRRPGFAEYAARTRVLIPLPRRGG